MGVNKLNDILKKWTPEAIKKVTYDTFRGQTWAIDASFFCYKFSYNSKSKKPKSHIDGFYSLFYKLKKAGINPILVFDGCPPQLKLNTIANRKQRKSTVQSKIAMLEEQKILLLNKEKEVANDWQIVNDSQQQREQPSSLQSASSLQSEIDKLDKSIVKFDPSIYSDIEQLCTLMGIPMKRADGEADCLCAKLFNDYIVDAVLSEDSDMLMYGIGNLMRKYDYSDIIEHVDLNVILETLNFSYEQFVDLCILCGTDYTCTIAQCGSETALSLIKSGHTIDSIYQKYGCPLDFNYIEVKTLVLNAPDFETLSESFLETLNLSKNTNWTELGKFLNKNCNYRLTTIENHKEKVQAQESLQESLQGSATATISESVPTITKIEPMTKIEPITKATIDKSVKLKLKLKVHNI